MRPSVQRRMIGVFAALGAGLLAGADVAADELVSELPSGPMCQADAPPVDPDTLAAVAWQLQQLPARAETPDGEPIVALDNRGYNYGQRPGPDLLQMQRELLQIHLETQQ